MSSSPQQIISHANSAESWPRGRIDLAAVFILLFGLIARMWAASGTFLNPDEALHFRLANQTSWLLAYRQSLTASHPPLLTFILYFWRVLGTSELWLRMPSILAGVVFCWMFYKWLRNAAGDLAGLIGLIFVSFLPPVVLLSAEIRQYALLLAFLASALYFLDDSFAKNSSARMIAFSLCLYLAMLSHYSAFWFAAALGIYALLRFTERISLALKTTWAIGQIGALALAIFLYKSHISKLGVGESRTALQGWMSDFFLRRSYFDAAHDDPLLFLVGHSFGAFQYFFGQLAVGDVMGLLFVLGVVLLLRGKDLPQQKADSRRLAILLLLPFAVAAVAALAHVYPYGGTRHIAFLIIPGVAGVSVAIARLAADSWKRGLAAAALIVVACIAFGKTRPPSMDRADQSRTHMTAAIDFIKQNVKPNELIFTDYQTDLILGHYLCQQEPISFEAAPATFEQFSCGGYHVVSQDYKGWQFWAPNFSEEWQRLMKDFNLQPGDVVWIVQAGWGTHLPQDLQRQFAEFRNLHFESFGKNILIFKLTVGQPMPSVAGDADFIFPPVDSIPARAE
ncbi:MAG: glycosyltransferase family 39 protein [Candidatus Sulfotelmatobacter sp.]